MTRDSIEVDELIYPIVIWCDRLVTDGGGAGRHRGAPGVYVEYGPVDTSMEALWSSDGEINPALGVRGGHPGMSARQYLRRRDGSIEELPAWGGAKLSHGESVVSFSNGGGGYGHPWERDGETVRKDVAEGWISTEAARAVYGVVVAGDHVDAAETAALRRRLNGGDAAAPPRVLDLAARMQALMHDDVRPLEPRSA